MKSTKVRIDKFLWCMRLFKTRSIAADYCERGKIKVNGLLANPSREIKLGDSLEMDCEIYKRTFSILALSDSRLSAKLVSNFILENTSVLEFEKLKDYNEKIKLANYSSLKPEKKDRRSLDQYLREQG